MADKSKSKPQSKPKTKEKRALPFGKRNYIWFGIALATIVIGYIFLGSGDITIAPALLVLGYCVLVPVAILLPPQKKIKVASLEEKKETTSPAVS